jgi:hypothetical protein
LKSYTPTYLSSISISRIRGRDKINRPGAALSLLISVKLLILLTLSLGAVFCGRGYDFNLNRAAAQSLDDKCRAFSGTVYDLRTLDILSGAVVTLQSGKKGDAYQTKTGENGKFSFYDIPAGTYTVKVSKDGYISDSIKLNLKKTYERYDTSIESQRDFERRNTPEYERNINRYANDDQDEDGGGYSSGGGSISMSPAPAFSPKDNFNGVSGFYNLPDCSVIPYGASRISYGVHRSKRLSSPATPYVESNYSTAVGYGLSENVEVSAFAFQHFSKNIAPMIVPATATTARRIVPPFYADRTGVSLKYAGKFQYKETGQVFPYSLLYSHYNDGSDEVAIPIEIVSQTHGKFYFIPTYISRLGGNVHFNMAYYKPLFIDHRKLSYMMEFVQNDKHRWNIINAGFRLEFKNDSAVNLFILSDSEKKRMSTGISGSILFK